MVVTIRRAGWLDSVTWRGRFHLTQPANQIGYKQFPIVR